MRIKKAHTYLAIFLILTSTLLASSSFSEISDEIYTEEDENRIFLEYALTNDTLCIDTDPTLLQTSNGCSYLFWEKYPAGAGIAYWSSHCEICVMINNGSGWCIPLVIVNNSHVNKDPFAFQDLNGSIHLLFSSNKSGNYDIYEIIGDGTDWSEPQRVTNDTNYDFDPFALVCNNGTIYLFWSKVIDNNSEIYQMIKNENGWGEQTRITSWIGGDLYPVAYQDSNKTIHLYWVRTPPTPYLTNQIYTATKKSDANWSEELPLTDASKQFKELYMLYDSKNVAHLYVEEKNTSMSMYAVNRLREFIIKNETLFLNRTISSTERLCTPCALEDLDGTVYLFGEYGGEIYDFANPLFLDYLPPGAVHVRLNLTNVITEVNVINTTIRWKTNLISTSIVVYHKIGFTQWYASQNLTLTINHTITLQSLDEGTYQFYVISTAVYNNTVLDNNNGSYYTFTITDRETNDEKQQQKGFIPGFETAIILVIIGSIIILRKRRKT